MARPERAANSASPAPWMASQRARQMGTVAIVHPTARTDDADALAEQLRHDGYAPVQVGVSRAMVDEVVTADPDVVVVITDEFDVLRACRDLAEGLDRRIVVFERRATPLAEQRIVELLDAGADDYVDQQSPMVLMARIRVAMRGRPPRPVAPKAITVGDLSLDLEAHTVALAGVVVKCPPLQYQLLVTLASPPGRLVTRQSLLAELWGADPMTADSKRLRIAVSVLRRILGTGAQRPTIVSTTGVGYRLDPPQG